MESKYFGVGFVSVFVIIVVALFFIYRKLSDVDTDGKVLAVFWGAIIFLFLVFGIIVISLFANRVIVKDRKKHL